MVFPSSKGETVTQLLLNIQIILAHQKTWLLSRPPEVNFLCSALLCWKDPLHPLLFGLAAVQEQGESEWGSLCICQGGMTRNMMSPVFTLCVILIQEDNAVF